MTSLPVAAPASAPADPVYPNRRSRWPFFVTERAPKNAPPRSAPCRAMSPISRAPSTTACAQWFRTRARSWRRSRRTSSRRATRLPVTSPRNARCVAKESGFGIDEPLDLHDYRCLRPVLTAMIRVENGRQPYTDAQIDAALVRAGVMPPERSLQQTRTVKGGQVAAAGTIGAGAIGAIQETVGQAHDALAGIVPYLDAAKWGLLAVTLIGIAVMLWARIDDRRMGLR